MSARRRRRQARWAYVLLVGLTGCGFDTTPAPAPWEDVRSANPPAHHGPIPASAHAVELNRVAGTTRPQESDGVAGAPEVSVLADAGAPEVPQDAQEPDAGPPPAPSACACTHDDVGGLDYCEPGPGDPWRQCRDDSGCGGLLGHRFACQSYRGTGRCVELCRP